MDVEGFADGDLLGSSEVGMVNSLGGRGYDC